MDRAVEIAQRPSGLGKRASSLADDAGSAADELLQEKLGLKNRLSSTPAGRALIPDLAALADENDAEAFGVLPVEDRRMLGELLRRIATARGLSTPPID